MTDRRLVGVLGALLVALVLSGCQLYEERICSVGEVPLYAIDNPTGAQCMREGAEPPPGFAEYPARRVPEVVGDRYDRWPLAADYPWRDEVDAVLRRDVPPR